MIGHHPPRQNTEEGATETDQIRLQKALADVGWSSPEQASPCQCSGAPQLLSQEVRVESPPGPLATAGIAPCPVSVGDNATMLTAVRLMGTLRAFNTLSVWKTLLSDRPFKAIPEAFQGQCKLTVRGNRARSPEGLLMTACKIEGTSQLLGLASCMQLQLVCLHVCSMRGERSMTAHRPLAFAQFHTVEDSDIDQASQGKRKGVLRNVRDCQGMSIMDRHMLPAGQPNLYYQRGERN